MSQQPWGLSWLGQEAPEAPGAWGRGSRRWRGAEAVDGHLQGSFRWDGKVCVLEVGYCTCFCPWGLLA